MKSYACTFIQFSIVQWMSYVVLTIYNCFAVWSKAVEQQQLPVQGTCIVP